MLIMPCQLCSTRMSLSGWATREGGTMGDMPMATLHLHGQVCCWGLLVLVRTCAGAAGAAQTAAATDVVLLWDASRDVPWCRFVCAISVPYGSHTACIVVRRACL